MSRLVKSTIPCSTGACVNCGMNGMECLVDSVFNMYSSFTDNLRAFCHCLLFEICMMCWSAYAMPPSFCLSYSPMHTLCSEALVCVLSLWHLIKSVQPSHVSYQTSYKASYKLSYQVGSDLAEPWPSPHGQHNLQDCPFSDLGLWEGWVMGLEWPVSGWALADCLSQSCAVRAWLVHIRARLGCSYCSAISPKTFVTDDVKKIYQTLVFINY